MNKTNAMRLLDGAGIPYKTLEYEADENNLAGVHVAEQMKKKYPVYFDESVLDQEEITISAGVRGCQLKLKARALMDYIGAEICSLT